jgi:hypothetical protein
MPMAQVLIRLASGSPNCRSLGRTATVLNYLDGVADVASQHVVACAQTAAWR